MQALEGALRVYTKHNSQEGALPQLLKHEGISISASQANFREIASSLSKFCISENGKCHCVVVEFMCLHL